MYMSKPLHARAAAAAFANGETGIRTHGALTFSGDVAWSYAEPVAVRDGAILYVTDAKFSVTTSRHTSQVASQWAIAAAPVTGHDGDYNVRRVDHGTLRQMVTERGQGGSLGSRGRHYERRAA